MKVLRRSANCKLYKHAHKKSEKNQNEDGDNHKSLWQGEWNHLLALTLLGSCLALGSNYHCMWCHCWNTLHQICMSPPWQHPPGLENHLWLWWYPLVFVCGEGKGEKCFFVHDSTFWCHNCNDILKHIMGCNAFTLAWAM